MDIDEANRITQLYAVFMEKFYIKLNVIFFSKLPQSLLPYDVQIFEDAFNIMAEYHFKNNNTDVVKSIEIMKATLISFVDDSESLETLTRNLQHVEIKQIILSSLKNMGNSGE